MGEHVHGVLYRFAISSSTWVDAGTRAHTHTQTRTRIHTHASVLSGCPIDRASIAPANAFYEIDLVGGIELMCTEMFVQIAGMVLLAVLARSFVSAAI